jgi:hypothetical protein
VALRYQDQTIELLLSLPLITIIYSNNAYISPNETEFMTSATRTDEERINTFKAVMRENGVPFNDLGTFVRANRYENVTPNRASATAA